MTALGLVLSAKGIGQANALLHVEVSIVGIRRINDAVSLNRADEIDCRNCTEFVVVEEKRNPMKGKVNQ